MRRGRVAIAGLALAAGCGGTSSPGDPGLTAAPACELPAEAYRLATLTHCPGELVLDDTTVVWLDGEHVRRMPKCGSADPPEVLASTFQSRLARAGGAFFLAGGPTLDRYDPADGSTVELVRNDSTGVDHVFSHDDGWVYFSTEIVCFPGQPDCGQVVKPLVSRVSVDGSVVEPIFGHTGGQIASFTGDGAHVFFTAVLFDVPVRIGRVDAAGGAMTELLPEGDVPSDLLLATDGAFVYYHGDTGIRRVPVDGGASSEVAVEPEYVRGLATDGVNVYWSAGDALRSAPVGGGPAVDLVTGHDVQSVVVDRGAVYFATCGLGGEDAGLWIVPTAR
jgi:hypothetical protein